MSRRQAISSTSQSFRFLLSWIFHKKNAPLVRIICSITGPSFLSARLKKPGNNLQNEFSVHQESIQNLTLSPLLNLNLENRRIYPTLYRSPSKYHTPHSPLRLSDDPTVLLFPILGSYDISTKVSQSLPILRSHLHNKALFILWTDWIPKPSWPRALLIAAQLTQMIFFLSWSSFHNNSPCNFSNLLATEAGAANRERENGQAWEHTS